MSARIISVTGADVSAAARFLEDTAAPVIAAQPGFEQIAASGDRSRGILSIITVWASRKDLEASDAALADLRREGLAAFGGEMTVQVFEQVASGVGEMPPQPGCVLRLVGYHIDPARIDELVSWFRSDLLPGMLATPGLRGVRNLVDRETGEGRVGVVYSDTRAMESGEAAREDRMAAAGQRGIEFGEETILEVLFGQTASA